MLTIPLQTHIGILERHYLSRSLVELVVVTIYKVKYGIHIVGIDQTPQPSNTSTFFGAQYDDNNDRLIF